MIEGKREIRTRAEMETGLLKVKTLDPAAPRLIGITGWGSRRYAAAELESSISRRIVDPYVRV